MNERTREDQVVTNDQQPPGSMTDVTLSANDLREAIARRAYEFYKLRGTELGDELSDWLRAEAEVVTMLLAEPQQTDHTGKRNGQPAARTRNTRGAMKANRLTQTLMSRSPKRKNVLKSKPA
jgi:hypothetical protein